MRLSFCFLNAENWPSIQKKSVKSNMQSWPQSRPLVSEGAAESSYCFVLLWSNTKLLESLNSHIQAAFIQEAPQVSIEEIYVTQIQLLICLYFWTMTKPADGHCVLKCCCCWEMITSKYWWITMCVFVCEVTLTQLPHFWIFVSVSFWLFTLNSL